MKRVVCNLILIPMLLFSCAPTPPQAQMTVSPTSRPTPTPHPSATPIDEQTVQEQLIAQWVEAYLTQLLTELPHEDEKSAYRFSIIENAVKTVFVEVTKVSSSPEEISLKISPWVFHTTEMTFSLITFFDAQSKRFGFLFHHPQAAAAFTTSSTSPPGALAWDTRQLKILFGGFNVHQDCACFVFSNPTSADLIYLERGDPYDQVVVKAVDSYLANPQGLLFENHQASSWVVWDGQAYRPFQLEVEGEGTLYQVNVQGETTLVTQHVPAEFNLAHLLIPQHVDQVTLLPPASMECVRNGVELLFFLPVEVEGAPSGLEQGILLPGIPLSLLEETVGQFVNAMQNAGIDLEAEDVVGEDPRALHGVCDAASP